MNDSIEKRIAAISVELERRRLLQTEPLDPLSASLYAFAEELAGLDALGKSALLYGLNHGDPLEGTMGLNLSVEDLERFIADYTEV